VQNAFRFKPKKERQKDMTKIRQPYSHNTMSHTRTTSVGCLSPLCVAVQLTLDRRRAQLLPLHLLPPMPIIRATAILAIDVSLLAVQNLLDELAAARLHPHLRPAALALLLIAVVVDDDGYGIEADVGVQRDPVPAVFGAELGRVGHG